MDFTALIEEVTFDFGQNLKDLVNGVREGDRIVQFGQFRLPVGGDVLVAIDGQPLRTNRELTLYLDTQTEVGQKVELKLVRDGEELVLKATLGERPQN